MSRDLFRLVADRLAAVREGAGFGPSAGAPPEPEPTALAAIAVDDDDARGWLLDNQREDGGFALVADRVIADAATPLAALALPPGDARERALDHVVTHRAQAATSDEAIPLDASLRGWGWTPDTFTWVEPTARALLALRLLRPSAVTQIADGLAVLADRECEGGGWNYGNPVVLGVTLEPYAQTTAAALIGLQGGQPDLFARGLAALDRLWRTERGGLGLGMSLAAFRLAGARAATSVREVEAALADDFGRTGLMGDVVSLAWAAIASGPGLESLRGH